jgi:putative DNA primase/helicase
VGEDGDLYDAMPIAFSDEALARRFTERHGDDLRFVPPWDKWLIWSGRHWAEDRISVVRFHARGIGAEASAEALEVFQGDGKGEKIAAKVASNGVINAIVKLAEVDPRHARAIDEWDRDPWILNTLGGIVDLRTGQLSPHDRNAHCTKITAVAPGKECPTWLRFLDDVTHGDRDLQAYLQRVAGYSLTGCTHEHALFFVYGPGGNGKGVFINTISKILGDYGVVASMETFTASQNDRHPTDLAMLLGARLVVAQETDEGRHWAEARIKAMTGGDPITARFMRQDFFTYQPVFKLVVVGNHKPGLRNPDDAMRRRLHMIPFTVKPPRPDKELPDRLKSEWPGILAWMIEGCLEWQRMGLAPPAAVLDATKEYFDGEDAIGRWLDERCEVAPEALAITAHLFTDFRKWAEASGEYVGTAKRLAQDLIKRGFERWREPASRRMGFRGLRLVRSP